MFSSSTFQLWALTTLLKLILCVCAWRGKNYPWWRAYITFTLTKSVALWCLALGNSTFWYTQVYRIGTYGEAALTFTLLWSFALLLFAPFSILPPKLYYRVKQIGCMLLLVLLANCASPHLTKSVYRAALLLSLALIGYVFALSKFLGIPWRSRPLWITFGLALYLLLYTFNPHSNATTLTYLIAELIWVAGYVRPCNEFSLTADHIERIKALRSAA